MALFRKKPIVIEAVQWWQPGDVPEVFHYEKIARKNEKMGVGWWNRLCEYCQQKMHIHGWMETLEGGHIVCPSDWIITGVKSEKYPVKNNIFMLTYEMVETNEQI